MSWSSTAMGGWLPVSTIMMVATAAPHRKDAFEAAEFLMDYLKSRAPFWKKEVTGDGAKCLGRCEGRRRSGARPLVISCG